MSRVQSDFGIWENLWKCINVKILNLWFSCNHWWIPSLNFQSKEIIGLYNAASKISIILDGAVGGFCTLLFCLVLNELHQTQWPQKPLTMGTSDEITREHFEHKSRVCNRILGTEIRYICIYLMKCICKSNFVYTI